MNAFLAIMWNGFREARRNRITIVVVAFAIILLLASSLVQEVTIFTFDRVITDLGLGVMSMILCALAIFLSCGLIPQEIEKKTIFLVVSRPVSRTQFIVARLAGNLLTLSVLLVFMVGVFLLQVALLRINLSQPVWAALAGLFFELVVLSAAGFFFSSFSSSLVAAACTTGLYFAGHLSRDIYLLAQKSASGAMKALGKGLYYAVPNLETLNFRSYASYKLEVPLELLGRGALMALGFTILFLVLASAIFDKRDFR